MNDMNSIIVEGSIESIEKQNGLVTVNITVTRDYRLANGEPVEEKSVFPVDMFGNMATIAETNAIVGRNIRVVGRLKQNKWKDQDEKWHSKISVVAEHVEYRNMK